MNTVKIAVYGTLMQGEHNHHFCKEAISILPCTLTGTLYDTGYEFPAFVPDGTMNVTAELVELPSYELNSIDWLEGYPNLYDRKMCKIVLESGEINEAWVYIMNELPKHATVIESGDWRIYRKKHGIH